MIEGLKPTVQGDKLTILCRDRAQYHRERVEFYTTQAGILESGGAEAAQFTGGDPVRALKEKSEAHQNKAGELEFIADNLIRSESYTLDRQDLELLGICHNRYR